MTVATSKSGISRNTSNLPCGETRIMAVLPHGTKVELSSPEEAAELDALLGGKPMAGTIGGVRADSIRSGEKRGRDRGRLVAEVLDAISPHVIQASGLVRRSAIRNMHEQFMRTTFNDHRFTCKGRMVKKYVPDELKEKIAKVVACFYVKGSRFYHNTGRCRREIAKFIKGLQYA